MFHNRFDDVAMGIGGIKPKFNSPEMTNIFTRDVLLCYNNQRISLYSVGRVL